MTVALPTKAAQRSGSAFGRLLARIAHDMNNCLARINGKAELALMLDRPERFRSALEEVLAAGQRASVLVADFQRVLAWRGLRPGCEEGAIPLIDALSVAARLWSGPREESGGLVAGGTGPRVDPPVAAALVIALGPIVAEAARAAPPGAVCRLEALDGPRGWRAAVVVPGLSLPRERMRELEGAEEEGDLAAAVATLREAGATVHVDGDRIVIDG